MSLRRSSVIVCVMVAGSMLAACGDIGATSAERRYINICTQYIGDKYANAKKLCRCQWKHIKAEVPEHDLDEFFFKMTAGRRFETKASRMIDRISDRCLAEIGAKPAG